MGMCLRLYGQEIISCRTYQGLTYATLLCQSVIESKVDTEITIYILDQIQDNEFKVEPLSFDLIIQPFDHWLRLWSKSGKPPKVQLYGNYYTDEELWDMFQFILIIAKDHGFSLNLMATHKDGFECPLMQKIAEHYWGDNLL